MARLERRPGMFRVQWSKRPVRLRIRPLRDLRGNEPRHTGALCALVALTLAGCSGPPITVNPSLPAGPPVTVQVPPTPPPPPVPPPAPAPGMATLQWTPPTENTDGSALTDLGGYVIVYGTDPASLTYRLPVGAGLTLYVIEPLAPGHWYFEMFAYNSHGVQSVPTTPVDKVIQ
jgi:hypothetical protein